MRNRLSGFTMVELLVVVGIIILLTALSIPTFLTIFKARALRDGARAIQMHMQRAQMEAIAKRRPMLVRFYPTRTRISGEDMEGKKMVSEDIVWKIQIVDSDGDDDLELDEDKQGALPGGYFIPWPEGSDPKPDKPPAVWQPTEQQLNTPNNHPHPQVGLNCEDDRIITDEELPEGVKVVPGQRGEGNTMEWAVYMFMPDGQIQAWRPDLTNTLPHEALSRDFKNTTDPDKGPSMHYDLAVENPQGERIYFDFVLSTGRLNFREVLQ